MIGRIEHQLGVIHLELFARLSSHSWRRLPHPPFEGTVARGAGHDPDRILLIGRAGAASWGVVSHELGLGGHLARATASLTGRGGDVEISGDAARSLPVIQQRLTQAAISRYDAIVLTIGLREAMELMPVTVWTRQLTSLLDHVSAGREVSPAVVVVGAEERLPVPFTPGMARLGTSRARALNEASRTVIGDRTRVRFVDSGMVPEMENSTLLDANKLDVYERSARVIAPTLATLLETSPARLRHPVDEEARARALEYLRSRDRADDARLAQLLQTVKEVLHLRSADLFFVDRDEVHMLGTTTEAVSSRPRSETFSTDALEYRGGIVIPDLTDHPRLRSLPEVTGPPHLRFYAAHPVESPDGHRVAVLSVVDTVPREFSAAEAGALRQLALQVGTILFEDY